MGLFGSTGFLGLGNTGGAIAGSLLGGPIGALAASGAGSGGGPNTSAFEGNPNLSQYGPAPGSSALTSSMNAMKAPGQVSADTTGFTPDAGTFTPNAYQAKDMSNTALPQYDAIRNRLNAQYAQTQDTAQTGLDRQFAASGGGPGNGAEAKQTENLASDVAKQKGQDLQSLNAQEAQTRTDLQNQENQKAFQSGESQKGMQFEFGQNQLNRTQAGAEAASAEKLSAGEFNSQMGMQYNQNMFDNSAKISGLDMQWDQAQAEANNNAYNKALSDFQAQHSGGLLGGGGFLGTGFG